MSQLYGRRSPDRVSSGPLPRCKTLFELDSERAPRLICRPWTSNTKHRARLKINDPLAVHWSAWTQRVEYSGVRRARVRSAEAPGNKSVDTSLHPPRDNSMRMLQSAAKRPHASLPCRNRVEARAPGSNRPRPTNILSVKFEAQRDRRGHERPEPQNTFLRMAPARGVIMQRARWDPLNDAVRGRIESVPYRSPRSEIAPCP